MFTGDALFQGLCENPADDGLRLMYADWLEEEGDFTRAEYIRLSVELASLPRDDPRQVELAHRLIPFRDRTGTWLLQLPRLSGIRWGNFRRGFVAEAIIDRWRHYRQQAGQMWNATPVEQLVFESVGLDQIVKLFEQPELVRLRGLCLGTVAVVGRVIELFRGMPVARSLRELTLIDLDYRRATHRHPFHRLTAEEVRPLLMSPQLERLERLMLVGYALPQPVRDALQQRFGARIDLDRCATVMNQV